MDFRELRVYLSDLEKENQCANGALPKWVHLRDLVQLTTLSLKSRNHQQSRQLQ